MSSSVTNSSVTTASVSAVRSNLAATFTLFAGLALVAVVGFAPSVAVHNAAHDTRHAAAFPCH
jgi:cobalt transporter subunit CbtB